jgi:putative spermidine/putrescine transport system permease protein
VRRYPIDHVETYHTPKISWAEILFYIFCGLLSLFLILPIFIVFPISISSSKYLEFPPRGLSLQWYRNFFGTKEWVASTLTSIKIATMTSLLASLLAIPAALGLNRGKFKGTQFIYSFLLSPMILPVIVIALAVYFHFARLHLVGNVYALTLAHTILAVPIVLITVSSSLQGFDLNLEHAAMSLGANRIKTFLKVTFPLIKPGVISGALFAFITSFDEVVIAIFLSGSQAITLPRRMWDSIREEIDPTIAAVSSLLIFTSIFLLLSVAMLRRRGEHLRGQ